MHNTAGVILAGGSGSRLWPITRAISKQLIPIAGRPMIYFPIATLMLAGIRDILLIASPESYSPLKHLLGDGSQFGLSIEYAIQDHPKGLAHGFSLAEDFARDRSVLGILGDNFFFGPGLGSSLNDLCLNSIESTIFLKPVPDASAFGVAELDTSGKIISIIEKPKVSKSNLAITGLYFFKSGDLALAKFLTPSERGELEITELLNLIVKEGSLTYKFLGRATFWSDLGTPHLISTVEEFIRAIEGSQSDNVLVPELIALENGWVSAEELLNVATINSNSAYAEAILRGMRESKQ
jgi:glucose-1-phosphate thymidylyltransferase